MIPALAALLALVTALLVYDSTWVHIPVEDSLNVLWVAIPLGLILAWLGTKPKEPRFKAALARFAKFDILSSDAAASADEPDSPDDDYRKSPAKQTPKVAPKVTSTVALPQLSALPNELSSILERVGDGAPITFFEIHPRIAYVAVTGASAASASDCTSVVMKLDTAAPSFEARPLILLDPAPPKLVEFKKDADFSSRYVVEGDDAKRIRTFLDDPLREELCDEPSIWVEAEGKVLALSVYGDFDAARTRRLLEAADVFFAEHGAEGGPSLLEPSSGTKSKKKKKKKKDAAPSAGPEESPA